MRSCLLVIDWTSLGRARNIYKLARGAAARAVRLEYSSSVNKQTCVVFGGILLHINMWFAEDYPEMLNLNIEVKQTQQFWR